MLNVCIHVFGIEVSSYTYAGDVHSLILKQSLVNIETMRFLLVFLFIVKIVVSEDAFTVDYTCKENVSQAFCLPANYSKMNR